MSFNGRSLTMIQFFLIIIKKIEIDCTVCKQESDWKSNIKITRADISVSVILLQWG